MRITVLSVCLMIILTGCGVEWFPGDETTSSVTITTNTPLPDAPTGLSYSQTLVASGGKTPYTWSLESGSSLPAGLKLSTDIITGIPTTTTTTAYNFTVKVTDSATPPKTATKSFSLSTPITVSDQTSKVFARILSFETTRLVVTVKNEDSVTNSVKIEIANYETNGTEIQNSAFPMSVTASAGASVTQDTPVTPSSVVNNWGIKSVSII